MKITLVAPLTTQKHGICTNTLQSDEVCLLAVFCFGVALHSRPQTNRLLFCGYADAHYGTNHPFERSNRPHATFGDAHSHEIMVRGWGKP
jgi:hypothetical protein